MAATKPERTEVDVLVVGAGPGGSAASYHLARHGVDVLQVERSDFPREKVCGDGLTPRAVKAILDMGIDTGTDGFIRAEGLRVYGPRGILNLKWPDLASWPPYGLSRTRKGFDELLARRAESAGAVLWERTEAVSPIVERDWVVGATVRRVEEKPAANGNGRTTVTPQGETREVRAKFVIAADGASSRLGAQVGVKRNPTRPLGIAARRYYRFTRPQQDWLEAWLNLYEGDTAMPGYGWVFAVEDGLTNVGAGVLSTYKQFKEVSARQVMDVFVRMLPPEWGCTEENAVGPMKSGPLPMAFNRGPLAVPGMLVVGDAAGSVSPFNGEGISYAMETGQTAAELISEALVKHRPGLAHVYPTVLKERYGKYFRAGRMFVKLIGEPRIMRIGVEHGLHREWLMTFAMRVLANLTDGKEGDARDKLMYALERMVPA